MSPEQNKKTVMVVDDDDGVRETLREILQEEGYGVVCARNGQEALKTLNGGAQPSLILLDMMMPVMDGRSFCLEQQKIPELSGIPLVVLAGSPNTKEQAREVGAHAFLMKPVHIKDLIDVVERCS